MIRRLARAVLAGGRRLYTSSALQLFAIPVIPCPELDPADRSCLNDLQAIALYQPSGLSDMSAKEFAQVVRRRLSAGHSIFAVQMDGRLAHYRWLSRTGRTYVDDATGLEYEFPVATRVVFDVFTHPAARRRGLQRRSTASALCEAGLEGLPAVHIFVEHDNAASKRNIMRAGASYVGSVWSTRILGRTRHWTNLPSSFHVRAAGLDVTEVAR